MNVSYQEVSIMCRRRLVLLTLAALAIVGLATSQAFSQPVIFNGDTYDATNNWWVYNYTLANPLGAPDNLYWFELTGLAGTLGPEPEPTGWVFDPGTTQADWYTDYYAPPDYLTYVDQSVAPDTQLSGFAFHSTKAPGTVSYEVWGDGAPQSDYTGTTTGPATPELSSGALLLLGMLPVGFAWLRRRKR
jgi:hypothetical protein